MKYFSSIYAHSAGEVDLCLGQVCAHSSGQEFGKPPIFYKLVNLKAEHYTFLGFMYIYQNSQLQKDLNYIFRTMNSIPFIVFF
jgi:hypothetical protein